MQHILYGDIAKVEIAILIKETSLNKMKIYNNYITPADQLIPDQFIAFSLEYQKNNKCTAAHAKDYLSVLLPEIGKLGINTLLVTDAVYFKHLTKNKKADPFYGYVCPCTIKTFEHLNVILAPNFQAILYNPTLQQKLNRAIDTLTNHMLGTYQDPGTDIIQFELYPETIDEIRQALNTLKKKAYPQLTCDIETRSLKFYNCGISTISFAWNQHEGIAFAVDRGPHAKEVRSLLKDFFIDYTGTLIWHKASFDLKVLIYQLWMDHLADYPNMLNGLDIMTRSFDDTKLIAYFATNNAVKNTLGLKDLSAAFTGNYAQEDIKDTEKIELPDLLQYNLVDCLATWYVYNKYTPKMIKDQQENIYTSLFKPSVKTLIQTELCGMPIIPEKVQAAKIELTYIVENHMSYLLNSPIIKDFHHGQLIKKAETMTKKAKKKVYKITDSVIACDFNPNSDLQLQNLIFDYMGYTPIDYTKGKAPATGGKTLEKLINHATDPEHIEIFEHLIGLSKANKILTSFIPAFEQAQQLPDGSYRLYGNFNLGSVQSLRLSSSGPNLQQIPSNSTHAKIIKKCFGCIPGWLFTGSDFTALESITNALITNDPNKLIVFTDGFDSHCLATYYYFKEQLPDIEYTVDSINSIKDKYPKLRQASKPVSFACQYAGTYITLMSNCGFPENQAKQIEARYHELYAVADAWIQNLIEKAEKCGYIPLAFGGRIRTPLIAQSAGKGRMQPYKTKEEERSAGNAATQSYCVLTLRAMNEFMERVWASPYKYDILPSATIHDAIYLIVKDSAKIVKWVNDNLIDCMAWQELPELKHPTIRISSSLEIYWPNWANAIGIPNTVSEEEIKSICDNIQKKTV